MRIKKEIVVVNNKFEKKIFIFNRKERRKYEINEEMFYFLKDTTEKDIDYETAIKMIDKETIDFLLKNNILSNNKTIYLSNFKEPKNYNKARIFMEITDKCNLKCKHCYGNFEIMNNNNIPLNKVLEIIKEAKENNVYEFDLTGGEPLLYPHLESVLKALYDAGMIVSIFSNLVPLTDNILKTLKKYNVKKVITSLDSSIEEVHDEFRGKKGSFKKTVSAINKLKESGIEVSINTMIGQHNINYIDKHIEFLKSFNVPYVLDVIVSEGRAQDIGENTLESSNVIKNIINKNSNNLLLLENYIDCGIAKRFIYIKSDGNIYICPSLIKEEFYLGNINKKVDINNIWENMDKRFSYIHCKDKNKDCKVCLGGCRARVYNKTGDINGPDEVFCNLMKGFE